MKYVDYITVRGARYMNIGTLYGKKNEATQRAKVQRKQRMKAVVREVNWHNEKRYCIFVRKQ